MNHGNHGGMAMTTPSNTTAMPTNMGGHHDDHDTNMGHGGMMMVS